MEKKKFEVPVLKICRFDCKDVIATSDPITPPQGGDWDLDGEADDSRVKSIKGVTPSTVSWD